MILMLWSSLNKRAPRDPMAAILFSIWPLNGGGGWGSWERLRCAPLGRYKEQEVSHVSIYTWGISLLASPHHPGSSASYRSHCGLHNAGLKKIQNTRDLLALRTEEKLEVWLFYCFCEQNDLISFYFFCTRIHETLFYYLFYRHLR